METETRFMDQMERFRASGNDLDALVWFDGDGIHLATDEDADTLLFKAAGAGWCSSISWLLAQGANVNRGRPWTTQTRCISLLFTSNTAQWLSCSTAARESMIKL